MNKFKLALSALFVCSNSAIWAGGLLTNTNQNVAFNRMMSREASIGIDGVYYNPAGVAFLSDGHHLSINWQLAYQTRTIKNDFPLFTNNVNNPTTPREFKGKAFAPVIPSLQYAYNKNKWSFQINFALTGGGGKCTFDNGLGSFEKIVSETAVGACGLASAVDRAIGAATGNPTYSNFSSDQMLGAAGKYSFNSYMHGRQYYYGLQLGAAYKMNDNLSFALGVRGVYALCSYYGYVKDIKVGNLPLYQMIDATKPESANIELSCDQSGVGFTPIIGIDYKTGKFNFSAKYEFKTRIRLKNKSVNQAPSIGNLPGRLMELGVPQAVLASESVSGAMTSLKAQFDTKLNEAIGEYEDGQKIAGDIPAYLTLGAGYKPIDALRINIGFHWFDDKHATSYNNRNKLLKRGTIEMNAGVEYDINKKLTVSTGWQNTNYGLSEEYMDDKSFVTSSNSAAIGGVYHINKKMDLNVAYFHTFYSHMKASTSEQLSATTTIDYKADYTRNNNVFAVGLDINF